MSPRNVIIRVDPCSPTFDFLLYWRWTLLSPPFHQFIACVVIFFLLFWQAVNQLLISNTCDALTIPSISTTEIVTETPPRPNTNRLSRSMTPTLDLSNIIHTPSFLNTSTTQRLYARSCVIWWRPIRSTEERGVSVRRIDFETGAIEMINPLSSDFFGEDLPLIGDKLIQLTWTSVRHCLWKSLWINWYFSVWRWGWGVTFDGEFLYWVMGFDHSYLDPSTFSN